MDAHHRLLFFRLSKSDRRAVQSSITDWLESRHLDAREDLVSAENTFHYLHGDSWTSSAEDSPSTISSISSELSIHFGDLKSGNLGAVRRALESMERDMKQQFASSLFHTIEETCDRSGQVVNAKKLSLPEALLDAFDKLELSINALGEVEMPSLFHPNPAKLKELLDSQPQSFHEAFEAVKIRKIDAARKKETERKQKYLSEHGL